jgi:hypothetical protein
MKLLDALFCDDIRIEANNKFSLMGLYNDRMVYPTAITFPVITRLAALLRFSFDKNEMMVNNFQFNYFINQNSILELKGQIQLPPGQRFTNLVIQAEGLKLERGELGYSIVIYNEKNEEIFKKNEKNALKILTEEQDKIL